MLRRLINRVRRTLGGKSEQPAAQPKPAIVHEKSREPQPRQPAAHRAPDVRRHVEPRGTAGPRRGAPERHGPPAHRRADSHVAHHDRPRPQEHRERRFEAAPAPRPVHGDWSVDEFAVAPAEGKSRFHDFNIPSEIMHAIADLGFQYCTPVQAGTLPPTLAGKDVAGQAQTGSGKTAAFLVAIFSRFLASPARADRKPGAPRALIIAPTRELIVQILDDAENLGKYSNFNSAAVFGGMDYGKQQDNLTRNRVDVLAATPGRLLDFKRRGHLDLQSVEVLVIDEADRMLDMGFIPDVKTIIRYLPPREKRQTFLFSATLSDDVLRLASQWMVNPEKVMIEPDKMTVDTVNQLVYAISSKDKMPLLVNLLQQKAMSRVIVFVNRRDVGAQVSDDLRACGVNCGLLSGAMPQEKRLKVLEGFRAGKLPVVVATDVAARGIHVDDVSHVINYDVPYEPQDYVHRIGRTARVGKNGTAIMFACDREAFTIPEIEKYIGMPIPCSVPEEALLKPPPGLPPHRERRSAPPFGRPGGFRGRPQRGGPRGGRPSGPPRRR